MGENLDFQRFLRDLPKILKRITTLIAILIVVLSKINPFISF